MVIWFQCYGVLFSGDWILRVCDVQAVKGQTGTQFPGSKGASVHAAAATQLPCTPRSIRQLKWMQRVAVVSGRWQRRPAWRRRAQLAQGQIFQTLCVHSQPVEHRRSGPGALRPLPQHRGHAQSQRVGGRSRGVRVAAAVLATSGLTHSCPRACCLP